MLAECGGMAVLMWGVAVLAESAGESEGMAVPVVSEVGPATFAVDVG